MRTGIHTDKAASIVVCVRMCVHVSVCAIYTHAHTDHILCGCMCVCVQRAAFESCWRELVDEDGEYNKRDDAERSEAKWFYRHREREKRLLADTQLVNRLKR